MYIPANGKFWIIWKVKTNSEGSRWITKEDCPNVVHADESAAFKEVSRLADKTGEIFVVLQATDMFQAVKVVRTRL